MSRVVLPNNIDIVIASFGGVGTTLLIKFLEEYKNTNKHDDSDGLKHSPLPPISFNPNIKFIYVYGSPQMAVASLFRRNFHEAQSKKLQKFLGKDKALIPKGMTLQEYASLGEDRFRFENHFFNWYDKYLTSIPTLFIRYETMFDNVRHLLEFAEIPEGCIDRFPMKEKRHSTKEKVHRETINLLDSMYGDFVDKLEKLNDIEIRQDGTRKIIPIKYLDMAYGRALVEQVPYELKCLLRNYAPNTFEMLKRMKR